MFTHLSLCAFDTPARLLTPLRSSLLSVERKKKMLIRFTYPFYFSSPILLLLIWLFFYQEVASAQEFGEGAARRNLKQEVDDNHEVHCSRERSRVAVKIIELYLTPFVDQEGYKLPSKCKLHSDNNMFREQEQHKIQVDFNEWKCGFCKKTFREEKYLDRHFDNRHHNLLNDTQGRCLADICGALHCDEVIESKKPKVKCNPAAAAKNRHLCETLASNCFPINQGPSASRLHELFLRQFCDAHTCSRGGQRPFARGGRKEASVFYLAICILIVLLLPLFYLVVYLQKRCVNKCTLDLKRISKMSRKPKPS